MTNTVDYLTGDLEEKYYVAQATSRLMKRASLRLIL